MLLLDDMTDIPFQTFWNKMRIIIEAINNTESIISTFDDLWTCVPWGYSIGAYDPKLINDNVLPYSTTHIFYMKLRCLAVTSSVCVSQDNGNLNLMLIIYLIIGW